jgi:hypothetical protein
MRQARLNDAAICLFTILSEAGIYSGIFGGYGIAVMGGNRESKDIDCLASLTKQEAIHLLDGVFRFDVVPQNRQDLGINVSAAKEAAGGFDPDELPRPEAGDVQMGLLA